MRSRIIAAMIALMFVTVASTGIYAQTPKGMMNKKGPVMREKIFDKLNLSDAQKVDLKRKMASKEMK